MSVQMFDAGPDPHENLARMKSFVTARPAFAGAASGLAIAAALSSPLVGVLGFSWTGLGVLVAGAATSGAVLGGLVSLSRSNHMLSMTVGHLSGELVNLRAAQEDQERRLADVEKKAAESPALVWRAAAADIEVLGGIVNSLAHTVSSHEKRLDAHPPETLAPPSPMNDTAPKPAVPPHGLRPALLPEAAQAEPAHPETPLTEFRTTLATALLSDKMELHLQPIVSLPQRQTIGYEASLCLAGQDGVSRSADDLRRIACLIGMNLDLDGILLERAVQVLRVLRARGRDVMMICQLCAPSLADRRIIEQLAGLLRGDDRLGRALVLATEVAEVSAVAAADAKAAETFTLIRQLGPTLSGIVPFGETTDVRPLAKLGIGHIRIDAATLLTAIESGEPFGDIHGADIVALLKRSGLDLSVTGVMDEAMVRDLLEQDAPMAQGDLFGVPRAVRPEVLEPRIVTGETAGNEAAARNAPATQAALTPQADPAPQRQSFRSLLRRA
jgi:cyclic-di-GMP phosphodiesterase, flagellum assembly factor TipF